MRHRMRVATVLLLAAGLAAPATVEPRPRPAVAATRVGDPRANVIIGGLKLILGRVASSRVFNNVDELTSEVKQRYESYLATAVERGDARTVQLLQQEQNVLLAQLDAVRNNAYQQFRKPEALLLFSTVANTAPVGRILTQASTEVGSLAGQVQVLRDSLAGGGSVNAAAVQDLAAGIDRWGGVWSMISGPNGRALTSAAERASASLRQIGAAASSADGALATAQADLTTLAQTLTAVQNVPRRPSGRGLFGFVANLLRVDRTLVDVFREVFNPRLRNLPGRSKADLERALNAAVVEMMRRRWSECTKKSGYEIRGLPDNTELGKPMPGSLAPALGPVDERLPLCQSLTTEQLVAEGETAPVIVAADGTPSSELSGGAIYTLDSSSNVPGSIAQLHRLAGGDLSVRDLGDGRAVSLSGESVGTPDVQLIFDFDAGTFSGSFDINYACDADRCGAAATGYARASFGPIPFTLPPTEPPDDFPFPDEHWRGSSDGWYAGAAVPIEVSLAGTDLTGAAAEYTTTVVGWISASLSPNGGFGDTRPEGWRASFYASIDHPDTVRPQWYLGIWGDADIWDGNVAEPAQP